jgi:hypothetical protein
VDVVNVADDHGRLLGRSRPPGHDVRHAGLDEPADLELLAALADLDRAQLAGLPSID